MKGNAGLLILLGIGAAYFLTKQNKGVSVANPSTGTVSVNPEATVLLASTPTGTVITGQNVNPNMSGYTRGVYVSEVGTFMTADSWVNGTNLNDVILTQELKDKYFR